MKTKSNNIQPHKGKIQTPTNNAGKKNGPLLHTAEKKQGKKQNCLKTRK
jgi:hypothetical protein